MLFVQLTRRLGHLTEDRLSFNLESCPQIEKSTVERHVQKAVRVTVETKAVRRD
jgi:hypothetical protein